MRIRDPKVCHRHPEDHRETGAVSAAPLVAEQACLQP
jgi:hypothetical protein